MTAQNISGLLSHRVYSEDTKIFYVILDMHTQLQIHPFVPRTFAMQLAKLPFFNKGAVATFVGECAGEWNLGSPNGLANMTESQRCTLGYHVAKCLIKAQILTMTILGFPLTSIHCARIWRHGDGFRLDFLACLIDQVTAKLEAETKTDKPKSRIRQGGHGFVSPVASGVAAIRKVLRDLGVDEFTPNWDNIPRQDVNAFHEMYRLLTGEAVLDLFSLLGERETYLPLTLIGRETKSEPFAPFNIQIHNQYFKWNTAVIVEPLQSDDAVPIARPSKLEPLEEWRFLRWVRKRHPRALEYSEQSTEDSTEPEPGPSSDARSPRSNTSVPRTGSVRMCDPTRSNHDSSMPRARARSSKPKIHRSRSTTQPLSSDNAECSSTQDVEHTSGADTENYLTSDYDLERTSYSVFYDN